MFPYPFQLYSTCNFPTFVYPQTFSEPMLYFITNCSPQQESLNCFSQVKLRAEKADVMIQDSPVTASPSQSPVKRVKPIKMAELPIKKKVNPSVINSKRKQVSRIDDMGQQKEGRNANSNLLRMFFRRLELKKESQNQLIENIIIKYQLSISENDFLDWLETNRIDYRNYVRVPSVQRLFLGCDRTQDHAKILRVLLFDFLQNETISCYLTSKKIKKEAMEFNYRSIRHIFNEILNRAEEDSSF